MTTEITIEPDEAPSLAEALRRWAEEPPIYEVIIWSRAGQRVEVYGNHAAFAVGHDGREVELTFTRDMVPDLASQLDAAHAENRPFSARGRSRPTG